jgi:hypothetical protein
MPIERGGPHVSSAGYRRSHRGRGYRWRHHGVGRCVRWGSARLRSQEVTPSFSALDMQIVLLAVINETKGGTPSFCALNMQTRDLQSSMEDETKAGPPSHSYFVG